MTFSGRESGLFKEFSLLLTTKVFLFSAAFVAEFSSTLSVVAVFESFLVASIASEAAAIVVVVGLTISPKCPRDRLSLHSISASTAQRVSVFSFSAPGAAAQEEDAATDGPWLIAKSDVPPSTSTRDAVAAAKSTIAESFPPAQSGSRAIVKKEFSKQSSVCSEMNMLEEEEEEDVTRCADSKLVDNSVVGGGDGSSVGGC